MTGSQQLYRLKDWQETVLFERTDGVKVTRVDAQFAYEGDLAGDTHLRLLMQYHSDQTGSYSGFEAFGGTFRGVAAEAVLHHAGTFDGEGVDSHVSSVERTGTGGLQGRTLCFDTRFTGEGPYELALRVD